MTNTTGTPRYSHAADVALTAHDDFPGDWAVVTGPLHPYGVDSIRYPSYSAALKAYRAMCRIALDRD